MNILEAIVLGIVQGITEFAPISSSAHLVIIPYFLGWKSPQILYMVTVHFGTLVAVCAFFGTELWQLILGFVRSLSRTGPKNDPSARLAWLIIVATIPAVLAGYFLIDSVEKLFKDPFAIGCFLITTGFIMLLGERMAKQVREIGSLRISDSIIIGIAQSLAIAPGISRSGITIAAGLGNGLKRESAARFSFLLSFPVILGAFINTLTTSDIKSSAVFILPLLLGFISAAISGYFCIKYLLRYLRKGNLIIFACYCFGMGIFTIMFKWLT